MSAHNGDRSRFNRMRKAGLLRRERSRLIQLAMQLKAAEPQADAQAGDDSGAAPQPASLPMVTDGRVSE